MRQQYFLQINYAVLPNFQEIYDFKKKLEPLFGQILTKPVEHEIFDSPAVAIFEDDKWQCYDIYDAMDEEKKLSSVLCRLISTFYMMNCLIMMKQVVLNKNSLVHGYMLSLM